MKLTVPTSKYFYFYLPYLVILNIRGSVFSTILAQKTKKNGRQEPPLLLSGTSIL